MGKAANEVLSMATPHLRPAKLLFVFLLFWSAITLLADGVLIDGAFKQLRAMTFAGQVLSSSVEIDGDAYSPSISYTYTTPGPRGGTFTSDRYAFGRARTSEKDAAARVVKRYVVGQSVPVYYNERDPSEASLRRGVEPMTLFMFIFMLPFNVVMITGWVVVAGWRRDELQPRACGGLLKTDDGARAVLLLNVIPPIGAAAGTAAVVAFLSGFVMAFTCGFDPPMWLMALDLGLIAIAGVLAYFWTRRSIARGDHTLEVNRLARSLILPRGAGGRDADMRSVRFADVRAVQMPIDPARQGEDSDTHKLTLEISHAGGSKTVELAKWLPPETAREAAEWLRRELGLPSQK